MSRSTARMQVIYQGGVQQSAIPVVGLFFTRYYRTGTDRFKLGEYAQLGRVSLVCNVGGLLKIQFT